ncbi:MAG: hypothetical protein K2L51_06515 [Clostridiales bacterium]|nr:hypothetical protein [Clostridiales bacterium]
MDSCTYPDGNGVEHYYKVPWTIGTAGIAYNLNIMDSVDAWLEERGESRRWNRTPPMTYYDLWQYCNDVKNAELKVGGNRNGDDVYPFVWSGQAEEWQWDYVVFDWWGQLAGPETMNTFKNFGDVTENFGIDWDKVAAGTATSDVYDPSRAAVVKNADGTVNMQDSTFTGWQEFKQAYTLWYDLICKNTSFSDPKVGDYSKLNNEQRFANGGAAMTPAACWIEYESREFLEKSGQEISIMPTPIVSDVVIDNGNVVYPTGEPTATAQNGHLQWAGFTRDPAKTIDAIRAPDDEIAAGYVREIDGVAGRAYRRVSFTSSFGDSVIIPQKATSKELAVEFLLFMQREENAQLFTAVSGGTVLPYKYDYAGSFAANGKTASAWQQSIFEINAHSIKFNNYTKHPMMRQTDLKGSAKMTSIWPKNEYYYMKAYKSPSSFAPSYIDTIYSRDVVNMWTAYKASLR